MTTIVCQYCGRDLPLKTGKIIIEGPPPKHGKRTLTITTEPVEQTHECKGVG